jgi:hypothetical protein
MREDGDRIIGEATIDMSNLIFYRKTLDQEEATTRNQHNNTTNDKNPRAPINGKCRR